MVKENQIYIDSRKNLVDNSPELQRASMSNASYDTQIKDVEVMTVTEKKYIQKSTKSESYKIRNKK